MQDLKGLRRDPLRGEVDLSFVGNLDEISNFNIETLGTHDFCIIASKSNSQYKKKISLKQYLKAGHVLYTPTEKPGSDISTIILRALGRVEMFWLRLHILIQFQGL